MQIKEYPPDRLTVRAITPAGRVTRWAADETRPENAVTDLRFSSTISSGGGGYKEASGKLARQPGRQWTDLDPLTTLAVELPGGHRVWEGRIERTPETSGEQQSIEPAAVGYSALLEDDKTARFLGIDRELTKWAGPGVLRKLDLNPSWSVTDPSVVPNALGRPALQTGFSGAWASLFPISEAWYDAKGLALGSIDFAWTRAGVGASGLWQWKAFLASDQQLLSVDASANLMASGPGSGTVTATAPRTWASVSMLYLGAPAGEDGQDWNLQWDHLAVWGDHGLTKREQAGVYLGLFASDILGAVLAGSGLNYEVGADGTIRPSSFPIEQFAYLDPTTRAEIIKGALRFHPEPWAVWDDRTFWWPNQGKTWRARVGPSGLSAQGNRIDRLWAGIAVQYQDVDGTTKFVSPPGMGLGAEDARLAVTDEETPGYGTGRYDVLQAGTMTQAGAVELGVRWLEETQRMDTSGQATLVGYVEDNRGVTHHVSKVRAGDEIIFMDAASTAPRRIVDSAYEHGSRTCTVDLGAPSEALPALIERLGVVLVSLGLSN